MCCQMSWRTKTCLGRLACEDGFLYLWFMVFLDVLYMIAALMTIYMFIEAKASFLKKFLVFTWGRIDQGLQYIVVLMDYINNADSKTSFLIYLATISFITIFTLIESLLTNGM